MPKNISPLEVITVVRFGLEQLSAKNAHHDFEHMCRHFSRQAIAANILPATGPVSAGGDQGRDFETFMTFIRDKGYGESIFLGQADSKKLVFACSLDKKVKAKIEKDINEICSKIRPFAIYFFSSRDIQVATRHKLQDWCMTEFDVRLEIIDGQALSEQLSQPELFWIAEEYLNIPTEIFPRKSAEYESKYDGYLKKWVYEKLKPNNYADFSEIKKCIRSATFKESRNQDVSRWIGVLQAFLGVEFPEDLRRRATYEICVAALRGQHDLNRKKPLVEEYFEKWGSPSDPSWLRDAVVLLTYCSYAIPMHEFDFDIEVIHVWSKTLIGKIEQEIKSCAGQNVYADLLQTRVHASILPFQKGVEVNFEIDDFMKWSMRCVGAAKQAPLFPIERFANILTETAKYFVGDPRYAKLTSAVDEILEKRSKGYLVAEKSRDRAFALLKADAIIAGINELHKSKARWFTGDTIRGSILALLVLSDAYARLGLVYAAKYHALGAAYIIARLPGDDRSDLLSSAMAQLAECTYLAGDWVSFSEVFPLFLVSHYNYASDPDNWSAHESVQRLVYYFCVAKSLSMALGGQYLQDKFELALRSMPFPEEIKKEILEPNLPLEKYERMSVVEITKVTSDQLWGHPFADCGQQRVYQWRALGITWRISSLNSSRDISYVEEFVSVLQIAICDFSNNDFCLLPTKVEIKAEVRDIGRFSLTEAADNKKVAFTISIPRVTETESTRMRRTQGEVLSVAITLLTCCSALPQSEIHKRLKDAFKNEISSKAFLVRPYWELLSEFTPREGFDQKRTYWENCIDFREFHLREAPELTWNTKPGFGYSKTKAKEFLKNRYVRTIPPMRKTLSRLKHSGRFQSWVLACRKEGLLDWQILGLIMNSVINFREDDSIKHSNLDALKEITVGFMDREEAGDGSDFPEENLYSDKMDFAKKCAVMSNAKTWGLNTKTATPDFEAWKELLNVKYFQNRDDIEHEDPFIL